VDNHVAVDFGTFANTYFLPSAQGFTLFSQTVTLTAPAQLSFQNVEPGNAGAILDNVSVTASATPEPASMTLLATGLFASRRVWRLSTATHNDHERVALPRRV
jgi:PEP-CTERM motif